MSQVCHRESNWKNDCKHQQEWLKKGQAVEADVASGVEDTEILMASYEKNTSQGKGWLFYLGSTVHVCSQKMFNSLVAKEEGIVKMVDGSTCEVIGTGTVQVTERDGTMCALVAVRYVREARYDLISIRVLDEEGCRSKCNKVSSQSAKETG